MIIQVTGTAVECQALLDIFKERDIEAHVDVVIEVNVETPIPEPVFVPTPLVLIQGGRSPAKLKQVELPRLY